MTEPRVIFETIHGSHLYGLAHAGSDRDVARVTTSTATKARHHNGAEQDTMTIPWGVFLLRIQQGSHQALETLFSPYKHWAKEYSDLIPYVESYRVTGSEVFAKYERTITKFCYGDFKRRRHAVRLSLNLRDLRRGGRFDPELDEDQIQHVNQIANAYTGDDLKGYLLE
jgi:hypothetical protein